jgi:hypothetical protein
MKPEPPSLISQIFNFLEKTYMPRTSVGFLV